MSDWHPQVVTIEKVDQHTDADALDIATVLTDYPVVIKRGEYKSGDIACYIPIDTIVPDSKAFYFLCPPNHEKYEENGEIRTRRLGPKYPLGSVPERHRRILAKRIRGRYSQGMLMPLSILPFKIQCPDQTIKYDAIPFGISTDGYAGVSWNIGDLIVDALGLKKFEEEEEDNCANGVVKNHGTNAAPPPKGWTIPHYDIDGIRKYLACLKDDEEVVLTEKLHGCLESTTLITMADESKKRISQIKDGDMVLGRAEDGTIIPTKVVKKFNNGRTNEWLKISGKIKGIAKSGGKFVVTCTPEHRFWNADKQLFVRAKDIVIGDGVEYLTNELELPIQKPSRYRGATWMPALTTNEFKPKLNKILISSIEKFCPKNKTKHDLETETHNYFASGVLVHNSNAAYCHDGEKLWVKSRNYYKKFDPDDMWYDIAIRYDLENKLAKFPMMVFFGEMVGQVKGFRYDAQVVNGQLHTKLYLFDVFDESRKRYLDYDDKVSMIRAAGLDPVPELYRGPWLGKDKMYPLAEGMTTLGGKHLREGWVLNTVKERYEERLDSRMQVKLVSEAYNLAKH